jgi:hypothetical protein
MKITVNELMRLRKDLSDLSQKANSYVHSSSYGKLVEDGVVMDENDIKFIDAFTVFDKVKRFELEVNAALDKFNLETGIPNLVRQKTANDLLLNLLSQAIGRSKPQTSTRFETVGNERKKIESVYTPYSAAREIKDTMKGLKAIGRTIQESIDKSNTKEVELSFSYDDIDEISAQLSEDGNIGRLNAIHGLKGILNRRR